MLLLGFPVVAVLAWIFSKPNDPAKADTRQRRHWKLDAIVTPSVIAALVISGMYAFRFSGRHVARVAAVRPWPEWQLKVHHLLLLRPGTSRCCRS